MHTYVVYLQAERKFSYGICMLNAFVAIKFRTELEEFRGRTGVNDDRRTDGQLLAGMPNDK